MRDNTDCNTYQHADSDHHVHTLSQCDAYPHSDADAHRHSHANADAHADRDAHRHTYHHTNSTFHKHTHDDAGRVASLPAADLAPLDAWDWRSSTGRTAQQLQIGDLPCLHND